MVACLLADERLAEVVLSLWFDRLSVHVCDHLASLSSWPWVVCVSSVDCNANKPLSNNNVIIKVRASFHVAGSLITSVQVKLAVVAERAERASTLEALNQDLSRRLEATQQALAAMQEDAAAAAEMLEEANGAYAGAEAR
eukprot:scaffold67892_cov29-Prasinocladus_malaysianus.AAC.1